MSEARDQFNANAMRLFAITAAGILLNLGLFFILALFAPLVVGMMSGYILGHKRNGIISSILSNFFSYSLIFNVTGFATDLAVFISAVLIMCVIGVVGGYIGAILNKRMVAASSQVSTPIRPGE